MDEETLVAIEQRCEAATPGPWYASEQEWEAVPHNLPSDWLIILEDYRQIAEFHGFHKFELDKAENDALFVVKARQDVPALVAEVRRLRQVVQELENKLARYRASPSMLFSEIGCHDVEKYYIDDRQDEHE